MKNVVLGTFSLLLLAMSSCQNAKQMVYYQGIDSVDATTAVSYETTLQPDDLLSVVVSAEDPEVASPFNLNTVVIASSSRPEMAGGQQTQQLYLVDATGAIDFPVLGKLQVGGLTRAQFLALLKKGIAPYIQNPIITVRIANFKYSVQGEVNAPGTYTLNSERITLIEALATARDLTIYGRRDNVLLIRENNGVKSFHRIDLTQPDFVHSPFYYLAQNDVIYVEPNKTKINGAKVGPNTNVIISVTSLLITLVTLIITTSK